MQFKEITEQAFMCVLYLCGCQRPRSIISISEGAAVPERVVKKILPKLHKGNIVNLTRGKNGGYALAKSPEKIHPYDVVILFEREWNSYDNSDYQKRRKKFKCPLKAFIGDIQHNIWLYLNTVSFLELYEQTDDYKNKCSKKIHL